MGGTTSFMRPVGPQADVNEMEYIACLHQAPEKKDAMPREDGSIVDEDIVVFLKSRYGIVVTAEEVRATILQGMQADAETEKDGDGDGEDQSVLDIMELMSILLIPLLSKSADLAHGRPLPKGVDEPPEGLIEKVLQQILPDVLGPEYDENRPPALTTGLLKRIFQAYGEDEIAQNTGLLTRMVESCELDEDIDTEHSSGRLRLDERTFAQGLVHDVGPLDIINETRKTTGKDDVFLSYFVPKNRQAKTIIGVDLEDTQIKIKQAEANDVETDFTFASIDLAASTYRSKSLMVFLYATVLITYFAYFSGLVNGESGECGYEYSDTPWVDNLGAVGCDIGKSVGVWLFFFFFLCFFGVAFVVCASIGNDTYCDDWRWPALGLLTVVLLTMVPFVVSMGDNTGDERYLRYVSFGLGLIVCTFHLIHIASLTISERWQRFPWIRQILNPSALYSEYSLKMASSHKINRMAQNAIDLLERGADNKEFVISSNFGRALFLFSKYGSELEPAGGIKWTWREARNKVLYSQEGIWYSARLLASNICQYIVSLYLIIGGFTLSAYVADNYDEDDLQEIAVEVVGFVVESDATLSLSNNVTGLIGDWANTNSVNGNFDTLDCPAGTGQSVLDSNCVTNEEENTVTCKFEEGDGTNPLCAFVGSDLTLAQELGLLNGTGFDQAALDLTAQRSLEVAATDAVASLYPNEQYMISAPLIIGVLIAFFVALNLAVSFLPSVTSTILQLRSGVIRVQGSPLLRQYRSAPESVAILIGSLFWGTLFSAILTGGTWGLIVFFFVWQGSAYFAQRAIAVIIGILVIFFVRYGFLRFFRVKYFQGFYRKRPAAANLATLALEWSSFALSSGIIFVRMVKILLVASFCIGRIDKPLLAPGVGKIGPIDLDGYPTIFMRDLLIHEAHRHPYIELLGTMYLYKIRYGENFGSTTGTCWRLLFVYGLMPWLHRYRIQTKQRMEEASMVKVSARGGDAGSRSLIEETVIAAGMRGGLGPTSFIGQNDQQTMENMYMRQIEQLKKENRQIQQLKKENRQIQKLTRENTELKQVLAALEQTDEGVEVSVPPARAKARVSTTRDP